VVPRRAHTPCAKGSRRAFCTAPPGGCAFKANLASLGGVAYAAAGVARSRFQINRYLRKDTALTIATAAHALLVTAIDLTRACAETELYLAWLTTYNQDSAFIASYLSDAAIAFQVEAETRPPFDAFLARENLADSLMAAPPLSRQELRRAARTSINEAQSDLHAAALAIHSPEVIQ
jgi:hypothetical protein